MQTRQQWRGVLVAMALVSALGCSGNRDAERPAPPATDQSTTPVATPAPAPAPAQQECAGTCYRELPTGGCESMPTCCPKTLRLKAPPHCPEGYTLDLNATENKCSVHHLCMD